MLNHPKNIKSFYVQSIWVQGRVSTYDELRNFNQVVHRFQYQAALALAGFF
jgi:hypothetical protein